MTARHPAMEGDPATAGPALNRHAVLRWLLLAAGIGLVGVGVVGIFVPLLPTTIFLLGAAACFGRSSPGAYRWLMTNRYFGRYLRDYHERRGATVLTKATAVFTLWGGIAFSAYLLEPPLWLMALLAAVALGVTVYLLRLTTLRQ